MDSFVRKHKNVTIGSILLLTLISFCISGMLIYNSLTQPILHTPSSSSVLIPPITQADLDQGWYYGSEDQKKPGTPDSWIFVGKGTRSAAWRKPEDTDTSDFLCPTTEWIDCMPSAGGMGKIECTNDFLSWAKINCPDFKGAAL